MTIVLIAHLVSTLFMTGVIWFVQVVHYPLMSRVGIEQFSLYEREHTRKTSYIVAPAMLVELITALALLFTRFDLWSWLGTILLAVIWLTTWLLSVPAHRKLQEGFNEIAHRRLVSTNWIRTIAWSIRAGVAVAMLDCWGAQLS